jgi:hypothetical protein
MAMVGAIGLAVLGAVGETHVAPIPAVWLGGVEGRTGGAPFFLRWRRVRK